MSSDSANALDFFDIFEMFIKSKKIDFPEIECVYFAYAKSHSLVKIGYSNNPLKRFIVIRRNVPFNLELLLIRPGTRELEKSIHKKLKALKVKGEWFSCSEEAAETLRSNRARYAEAWNLLAPHFPNKPFVVPVESSQGVHH